MAAFSSPDGSSLSNEKVVKDIRSASVDVLRKTAHDVFLSKTAGLENNMNPEDRLPKFDTRELTIGRVLGRGAFCVVKECSVTHPTGSNLSLDSNSSRGSLIGRFKSVVGISSRRAATNEWNGTSNHSRGDGTTSSGTDHQGESARSNNLTTRRTRKSRSKYVVKQLSPDLIHSDKITFLKGLVDLAMETRFLASLDHDHIIAARGVSSTGAFSDGYFIILEKINDTLSKRVKKWMDMDRQCKGITGVFTGSKKMLLRLDTERLLASYDLARGMNYLHERKIVFRDLKPDNVGFDYVGVLKIFDFGLAKELRDDERTADGLYKMTGCTGAVRYMSPENAKCQPYNLLTDVYSWAMIMWFIMALEPPFALYTESMILARVTERGYRPKTFSSWSPRIGRIINRSWSADIHVRPSFAEIAQELKKELVEVDPKQAVMLDVSREEPGFAPIQESCA